MTTLNERIEGLEAAFRVSVRVGDKELTDADVRRAQDSAWGDQRLLGGQRLISALRLAIRQRDAYIADSNKMVDDIAGINNAALLALLNGERSQ